jgi:proline iminopeptidase
MTPKSFNTGYLPELDGHEVFFSQYGNPDGPAIISLHGGPGSKSKPTQINGFDLDTYHLIAFDQRGCGKSQPAGKTDHNTTQDLITDIERLRNKLTIEKWFVTGGSWGAGLALAYAQTHPTNVLGLMLKSLFLARPVDNDWAFSTKTGVAQLFPDVWEKRDAFFKKHNTDPKTAAQSLLHQLENASPKIAQAITAGVTNWEGNLMNAYEDISYVDAEDIEDEDIASTKIFLHYEANNFFLEPDQLIKNLESIHSIPTILVHGRYDVLCPVEQMWQVQARLEHVETVILPSSNHKLTAEGDIAKNIAFSYFLHRQTL